MKLALVYYQEQENLNTKEVLNRMKEEFEKEDWELAALIVDQINSYDNLMIMITKELVKADILYLYSKSNITDDFYWNLLCQTSKIENVSIKEYLK
ncbi:hypothetical protein [Metabacillus niabensis]|uniref:hypothetical protein n=1 Tax=Metabacillus niabensis TaxID=324854 RepID=UPI001CF96F6F|nr:hypothetical protein [Metabacillus niabensis]